MDNSIFDTTTKKVKIYHYFLEKKKGIQWNVWSEVYGGSKDDLRKPEGLGLISPASFQQLEDFDNESNLEVFKCSYREEKITKQQLYTSVLSCFLKE